jgi:dTDP-glucose 4,6-dehydratase
MSKTIVVTGGAGFIGSNFLSLAMNNTDWNFIVVDSLTYAGDIDNIDNYNSPRIKFVPYCITSNHIEEIIKDSHGIINFAAETHVDRSIKDSGNFIETNILGVHNLLEISKNNGIRFLQISTDEVYGSIDEPLTSVESGILNPSSPYSSSKASAELIVQSYIKTFGINATIVRGSNNYGPKQHPEKLIPLAITNLLNDKPIPIYGSGEQIRNWIHVSDFCLGVLKAFKAGKSGEIYNLGGTEEVTNNKIVATLIEIAGKNLDYIKYVDDRLAHDFRYSLNSNKAMSRLNWKPTVSLTEGLEKTFGWYEDRPAAP